MSAITFDTLGYFEKLNIERRKIIRLTMRDQELLVKSLLEDWEEEPPQHVKGIAQEYAARVTSE